MAQLLGKLRQVQLQEFWQEAAGFSAWLAQQEILDILGDAIGQKLKLVQGQGKDQALPGTVMVQCTHDGSAVLVQGQVAQTTPHDLGKWLEQAATVHPSIVVWVAEEVSSEHLAVMAWLQDISEARLRCFAAELELWCIDDSAPAPKFTVIFPPRGKTPPVADGQNERAVEEPSPQKSETKQEWKVNTNTEKSDKGTSASSTKEGAKSSPKDTKEKEGVSVRQNFVYTKTYR